MPTFTILFGSMEGVATGVFVKAVAALVSPGEDDAKTGALVVTTPSPFADVTKGQIRTEAIRRERNERDMMAKGVGTKG
jgi:hypothetical protein